MPRCQKISIKEKCNGDFCDLGRSLNPDSDLVPLHNQDEIKSSRKVELGKERARAARIAQRVLSESEIIRLEESGKLLQLRVIGRINPLEFQLVFERSINIARKEHRLALAQLFDAEEKSLISKDSWQAYLDEINDHASQTENNPIESKFMNSSCMQHLHAKNAEKNDENKIYLDKANVLSDAIYNLKQKRVCGICVQVYKLLDQVRDLLWEEDGDCYFNEDSKSDNVSKHEELTFLLSKQMGSKAVNNVKTQTKDRVSNSTPTKDDSSKRKVQGRQNNLILMDENKFETQMTCSKATKNIKGSSVKSYKRRTSGPKKVLLAINDKVNTQNAHYKFSNQIFIEKNNSLLTLFLVEIKKLSRKL